MVGIVITLLYDEARRIWCYRWLVTVTTAIIFCAAALYILHMPNVYDAWTQIYVNKQTPLTAATQGVSLVGDNYGSTYVVQKTLLNDQNLEKVVKQINPAARTMSKPALEGAIGGLRSKISVGRDEGDGFLEFHYKDSDPIKARNVVQLLLNQFISANVDRSRSDLGQAGKFLDQQIASYETMLADSQTKLAAFRRAHPSYARVASTGSSGDGGAELAMARAAYGAALSQSGGGSQPAPKVSPYNDRISSLESRLASLRTQYTDQYPDVVSTKRQLATAEAEKAQAESAAPPVVTAPAPDANPGLAEARQRLAAAEARSRPRRQAAPVIPPAVDSQWTALVRNDELLRTNYQQLLAHREATKMSQAVYGADNSGKYQVTRAPTVPSFPSGPNRTLYLALAAVVAMGGGLAIAYLRGAVNGIFVSPRELEEAFQLPVVGTVSWEPAWHTGASTSRPSRAIPMAASIGLAVVVGLAFLIASNVSFLSQVGATIQNSVASMFHGSVQ
jgi:polysaccharide chain length determinant protein (PEP-CTERM system associated)